MYLMHKFTCTSASFHFMLRITSFQLVSSDDSEMRSFAIACSFLAATSRVHSFGQKYHLFLYREHQMVQRCIIIYTVNFSKTTRKSCQLRVLSRDGGGGVPLSWSWSGRARRGTTILRYVLGTTLPILILGEFFNNSKMTYLAPLLPL